MAGGGFVQAAATAGPGGGGDGGDSRPRLFLAARAAAAASRLGRSGPGAGGAGIEGSRRRGGRGRRRGLGPPRGGRGRGGRWAVANARPRSQTPAAGTEGGEPPLAPEVGPAALAGGLPEQPQNKNRLGNWANPQNHRDPL